MIGITGAAAVTATLWFFIAFIVCYVASITIAAPIMIGSAAIVFVVSFFTILTTVMILS